MSSTRSSLVLGLAAGLPPTAFEPFARSLRATGYMGRLGLVLGDYSDSEVAALDRFADFSFAVHDQYDRPPAVATSLLRWSRDRRRVRRVYPFAFSTVARATRERCSLSRWSALEYHLEGLQALRYNHYYEILQAVASDADYVLLTDARDVIFQSDPFSQPVDGLEVFLEASTLALGTEPRNRKWLLGLYGRRELAALAHQPVSCSGTVIGRHRDVVHYLREMTQHIVWRRRPLGSHDQGIHNYLLRRGRLAGAKVVRNGEGRVLTMGAMTAVSRDEAGRVLNTDGTIPAVLHQYDRHPILASELVGRFTNSSQELLAERCDS